MPILRKAGIIRTRHKNATGADTRLKFGMSKLFGTKNKYKKVQIDWVKGRPILPPPSMHAPLNIEKASFTPLVFSTSGGMGPECHRLHKR